MPVPLLAVAQLSIPALLWVVVAFSLGSWAQAVSGFGFALITIPLTMLVVPRLDAVIAQTFVGCVVTTSLAWKLRADVDRSVVKRTIPTLVLGLPLGIAIGRVVSDQALRIVLGVGVLVATAAFATGFRLRGRSSIIDPVAGLMSGVLATTTGTNGPPLVIALAGRDHAPVNTRATLQWLFAGPNFLAMALFGVDGKLTFRAFVVGVIGLVPALLVRRAGERAFSRLDPARYRVLVLGMLTLAGVTAIITALR